METTAVSHDEWRRRFVANARDSAWLFYLGGALFIILGLLAIAAPLVSSVAVELMIGWLLVIGGLFHLFQVFRADSFWGVIGYLLIGLMFIGAGLVLLNNPLVGTAALTLLLAAFILANGVVKIIMSLTVRPLANWGWILVSGLMSVLVAVIIYAQYPFSAAMILGLLFGINMMLWGVSMLMLPSAAEDAA